MEFFRCPCPEKGNVILDGNDQGPNMDEDGSLLTKQCNSGLHYVFLRCHDGQRCLPRLVEIKDTDPISPMEVPFRCGY